MSHMVCHPSLTHPNLSNALHTRYYPPREHMTREEMRNMVCHTAALFGEKNFGTLMFPQNERHRTLLLLSLLTSQAETLVANSVCFPAFPNEREANRKRRLPMVVRGNHKKRRRGGECFFHIVISLIAPSYPFSLHRVVCPHPPARRANEDGVGKDG
jgi:hypothetical protein